MGAKVLASTEQLPVGALERTLRERVDGEVRFDAGTRATYATDASNFRQTPIGVVLPRSIDAAVDALAVCAEFGAPVLSRGGGTSLAGECCNAAVIIDWTKYCHRIEWVDAERRRAMVQPGVVLDQLNRAVAPHGLQFGPKPATHGHCTIGGMIGNNSCGASAQAYGKTADNVVRLEVLCYDGTRFWVGEGDDPDAATGRELEIRRGLARLADEYADEIRARFPDIPRRVSGYSLDELLPERGGDLAKVLCGSESTLVTVLRAEVSLVPLVPDRAFVLIGYDSIADAADAVPDIVRHDPLILEGMDDKLIEHERRLGRHDAGLRLLPDGRSWLLVQLGDGDRDAADRRARELVSDLGLAGSDRVAVLDDPEDQRRITAVREDALGATARVPGEHAGWPGWEDAAVPPERLGDYLRDFGRLLDGFGYGRAPIYGHFGHGCVHARIPFELTTERGIADYRRFVERAAHLVTDYGGSLSGEHGDGQARGALLPIMFGDRIMDAFRRTKTLFDPLGRMNPGKLVDAYPVDANLRFGAGFTPLRVERQQFAYPDDGGMFANAAARCVGVGACRDHTGGVMCPSYRATGEEEHSTRGRARLLFEMMTGEPIEDGWRSEAVRDALDLCFSCKGCRSDCPVGVDMATYKAEFLAHHYRGRLRPMAHYTMGWLPLWARLARIAPAPINAITQSRRLHRPVARLAGLEPDRPIPAFAGERFASWYRRRGPRGSGARGEVLLWPDTFTDNLHPGVARAAVEVLEEAGYRVVVPSGALCCGLTWISTGQLGTARRVLARTARRLRPWLDRGVPVIGLEPSCTAVFRADGPELLPRDGDVRLLAQHTRTFAELLDGTDGWRPPGIGGSAVVQPHCHQHSVLGFAADERILQAAGIDATLVGGCCGLAGNFGFEPGHLEVSVAASETELMPAVRAAGAESVVLADGFSCRTQIEHSGSGRQAMHLAELLAAGIRGMPTGPHPEYAIVRRPGHPQSLPPDRRGIRPFIRETEAPPETGSRR